MRTKANLRSWICCLSLFSLFLLTFALSSPAALAQETTPPAEATKTEAAPAATDEKKPEAVTATAPAPTEEEKKEEAPAEEAPAPVEFDYAKNAWLLLCSALVLFMTAPGLAMFYGGLVRKKNVISVMMQCVFLMGLMTLVWAIIGYTIAFGGNSGEADKNLFVGNMQFLLMNNVGCTWDDKAGAAVVPMNGTMPEFTFMLFQGMFFIITPALICGAFAERMKFSAMAVFMVLWGVIVYCPLCHWVWDAGFLAFGAKGALAGGAIDFAGGTVVHISSGVTALICALVLGQRQGYKKIPMPPHNLTYTAMGAAMLWFGWFGFNAGSALAPDGIAATAFAATHFSAAAGAVAWALIEWVTHKKPTLLGTCSGAVAGLVCITPAAGYVNPMPAILMGLAAGVVCFFACTKLKNALGYDDSLDAFGVHGIGGILGAVLTGVFATRACNSLSGGKPFGLIDGNSSLIIGQLAAVGVTVLYAAVVSLVLLKLIDFTIGLRVSKDAESQGLDLTEHGEEGYIFM